MMNRYTFIVEFRGGTYVSQVMAQDEAAAVTAWAKAFAAEKPAGRASGHMARNLMAGLANAAPTALTGLSGAWYVSALVGGDLLAANIVLSK